MSFAHALPPVDDDSLHRQSPHNIEVEQALLGAILINNEAFYRVSDFLEPPHFYDPLHRQIYEKAAQLIRLGKVADPRTIKSFLKENELVGDIPSPNISGASPTRRRPSSMPRITAAPYTTSPSAGT
jgi:replicative DNA helicase